VTAQLAFDLPRRTALGRSDFFVSDSNASAVGWIDRWPVWPCRAVVVHGAAGCGKTHLARLWCERASATFVAGATLREHEVMRFIAEPHHCIVIDDADRARELALLHLHNLCLESGGSLLMTARRAPGSWTIALDDLRSRLRAALAVEIGSPDDALLGAVLVKHFADRQLRVAPELVLFLVRHIERSFSAAAEIADRLDAVSLRDGRAITVPLARSLLAERNSYSGPANKDFGVT
jgi:chromosomal replication initiation ATPase DnaA